MANPFTLVTPTQPNPKPKPKRPKLGRVRGGSPHPGVVLIPPAPERHKRFYSARYTEPDSGRGREVTIPGCSNERAAADFAKRLSANLTKRKLALLSGDAPRNDQTVQGEADAYCEESAREVSGSTLRQYSDGLAIFVDYLQSRSVVRLDDVTRAHLSDYRSARIKQRTRFGEARKNSTINQELKPVRQMLIAARKAGRFNALDSDAIGGALKRLKEPKPEPRCFTPPEIRLILQAAIKLDADPRGRRDKMRVAPAIAVGLLTGMRRNELASVKVAHVLLDAATASGAKLDLIELPKEITKTQTKRDIDVQPYSPLLAELLRVLVHRSECPKSDPLLDLDYEMLGSVAERLPSYGAPADFCIKSLRSTCASYQLPVPGDMKRKAERQGHTLEVAARHYLSLPRGTPQTASSLDEVMQCEDELRAIISASRVRTASAARKRVE